MEIKDNTTLLKPTFRSSATLNLETMSVSDFKRYAKFTFPEMNFEKADNVLNGMDADFAKNNDGTKLFNNAQKIYLYHFTDIDSELFNQLANHIAMIGKAPTEPLHVVNYNGTEIIAEFAEAIASVDAVEYANKIATNAKSFVTALFKQDNNLKDDFSRFDIKIKDKPEAQKEKPKSNDLAI